ncbi:hypothetical protein cand_017230 [Cryptosporidium andersoni]|uniref:Uncharacterized protein n=1 Tax=Cryptosporidium andersoni TaxID=117008 RepID=A0A1J4MVV1_9CRYT|nr:hypothetical protein cand_017230 [Cryptosporidium andersoni]
MDGPFFDCQECISEEDIDSKIHISEIFPLNDINLFTEMDSKESKNPVSDIFENSYSLLCRDLPKKEISNNTDSNNPLKTEDKLNYEKLTLDIGLAVQDVNDKLNKVFKKYSLNKGDGSGSLSTELETGTFNKGTNNINKIQLDSNKMSSSEYFASLPTLDHVEHYYNSDNLEIGITKQDKSDELLSTSQAEISDQTNNGSCVDESFQNPYIDNIYLTDNFTSKIQNNMNTKVSLNFPEYDSDTNTDDEILNINNGFDRDDDSLSLEESGNYEQFSLFTEDNLEWPEIEDSEHSKMVSSRDKRWVYVNTLLDLDNLRDIKGLELSSKCISFKQDSTSNSPKHTGNYSKIFRDRTFNIPNFFEENSLSSFSSSSYTLEDTKNWISNRANKIKFQVSFLAKSDIISNLSDLYKKRFQYNRNKNRFLHKLGDSNCSELKLIPTELNDNDKPNIGERNIYNSSNISGCHEPKKIQQLALRKGMKERKMPILVSTRSQISGKIKKKMNGILGNVWLIREISLPYICPIWKISVSVDGEWMAVGSQDGFIRLWKCLEFELDIFEKNMDEKSENKSIEKCKSIQEAGSNRINNSKIYNLHDNSDVNNLEMKDKIPNIVDEFLFANEADYSIRAHSNAIISIQWENLHSSHRYLTTSMDRTVKLWKAPQTGPYAIIQCSDWPTSAAFHPSQRDILFIGCLDASVQIWRIYSKVKSNENNSKKLVGILSEDNSINLVEVRAVEIIRVQDLVTILSLSPNGNYLACGFRNGGVAFYDTRTLKYRCDIDCRNRRGKSSKGRKVSGLCWKKDNKGVLVTTNDSRIRLFNLNDVSTFAKYKGHVNKETLISAEMSINEDMIVCGSENGYICTWNVFNFSGKDSSWYSLDRNNNIKNNLSIFRPNNGIGPTSSLNSTIKNATTYHKRGPTHNCVDSFKAFDGYLTASILAPKQLVKKTINGITNSEEFSELLKNIQLYGCEDDNIRIGSETPLDPVPNSKLSEDDVSVFIAASRTGLIRIFINIPIE